MKARNQNIDAVKGVLILFVVLGHLLLGGLETSFLKYSIYCFHMPVFIFVSGYLLPLRRLMKNSVIQVFLSYRYRVLFPWILAVAIFCFINIWIHHAQENPFLILLRHYVKPFYHLWYIPTFLLFVVLSVTLFKRWNRHFVLGIAVLVSCFFYFMNKNGILENGTGVFSILINTFRMQYWMFFVWGSYCKDWKLKLPSNLLKASFIMYVLVLVIHWFTPSFLLAILIFIPLNAWIMMAIPQLCCNENFNAPRWLVWCGEQTLGIYLWHMIPILLIKHHAASLSPLAYYLWTIGAVGLLFYLIHLSSRIRFFRVWFLGIRG
jgi:acyltransferase